MNIQILRKQTHFTYLVEGAESSAEKVIELGEMQILYQRFAQDDLTLTDEEQLLALIYERAYIAAVDVAVDDRANTDELI